jgi:TolB protein
LLPKFKLLRVLLLPLLILIFGATPAHSQSPSTSERIAFAAYRNGQWDIYSLKPDGSDPRQITNDPFDDTDPAYSPDGTKIAYASRRDNNWDVYVLDLLNGEETRLTDSPHYDGAPTWSPDGERLAYESYHTGNLDIWRIDVSGSAGEPGVNLTSDSLGGDFGPAWSPDGRTIAFTRWPAADPDNQAAPSNKDLYLLEVESGELTRLTDSPAAEEWPAWHPDGDSLTFVLNDLGDREVYTLDVAEAPIDGGAMQPVTWLGRTDGPVWSPDGQAIATVFHRWDGEIITIQNPAADYQLPHQITGVINFQGRLSWHEKAVRFGQRLAGLTNNGTYSQNEEHVYANGEAAEVEPYNLVRLNDLDTGTPWLADTVDDSFQDWRFELRAEVGYDFLGKLSDALRDVASYTDTSQYASWHKSGRAVDTLFDYYLNGELAHEIVREDYSGETYWRVLLRCTDQTGRCGRPVVDTPWNYSARARTQVAPEQGGLEKAIPSGYYVDMTALAREYGWQRISSYDDDEYGWTWHFLAFEYWHYQKRLEGDSVNGTGSGVANWYQAMQDVYPQETLDRYFTWQKMRARDEDPHLIALKGVPLPLQAKPWWELIEESQ